MLDNNLAIFKKKTKKKKLMEFYGFYWCCEESKASEVIGILGNDSPMLSQKSCPVKLIGAIETRFQGNDQFLPNYSAR